jgi:hypothetical protein
VAPFFAAEEAWSHRHRGDVGTRLPGSNVSGDIVSTG